MISRRTFLQSTAALAPSLRAAPSDKIRVGFIGIGAQGAGRLREFMRHPEVTAAAICDADQLHLDAASAAVEKTQGHKPASFRDFRALLDTKDIDAVMIATPDHWHALPSVLACQAGKDVFVEKPMAYSIAEGRAMANAEIGRAHV